MADYYNSFATFIPCISIENATLLLEKIEKSFVNNEDYSTSLEYCEIDTHNNNIGVFLADEYNMIPEEVTEAIQDYLIELDLEDIIIISGNYGCSKLRPGDFGGWTVGICKEGIEWIDAPKIAFDIMSSYKSPSVAPENPFESSET